MKNKKAKIIITSSASAFVAVASIGVGLTITQNQNNNLLYAKKSVFNNQLINTDIATANAQNEILSNANLAASDANIAKIIKQYSSGNYQKSNSFYVNGSQDISTITNFGGYTSTFVVNKIDANTMRFAFVVSNSDGNPNAVTPDLNSVNQYLVIYDLNIKDNTYERIARVGLTGTYYTNDNSDIQAQALNAATDIISDGSNGYIIYGANNYISHYIYNGTSFVINNQNNWNSIANFLADDITANNDVKNRKWITTSIQVEENFAYISGEGQYIAKVNISDGSLIWRKNSIFTSNDFSNNNIGDSNIGWSNYHTQNYIEQWSATVNLVIKNDKLYAFGGATGYFAEINTSDGNLIGVAKKLTNSSNSNPINRISDVVVLGSNDLLGNDGGFAIASKGVSEKSDGKPSYVSYVDVNGIVKKSINIFTTATPTQQFPNAISNPGSIRKLIPNGLGGVNVLTWNTDVSPTEIFNYRKQNNPGRESAAYPSTPKYDFWSFANNNFATRFTSQLFNIDSSGIVVNTNTDWSNIDQDNETLNAFRINPETGGAYKDANLDVNDKIYTGPNSYSSLRNIFYDGNGGYYGITVNNTLVHLNSSGYELEWKTSSQSDSVAASNNYVQTSATKMQEILDTYSAAVSTVNLDLNTLILGEKGGVRIVAINSNGTSTVISNTTFPQSEYVPKTIKNIGNNQYLIDYVAPNPTKEQVFGIISLKQNASGVVSSQVVFSNNIVYSGDFAVSPIITPENNGKRFIYLANTNTNGVFSIYTYDINTNTIVTTANPGTILLPAGSTILNMTISSRNNTLIVAYYNNNQLKFRIYGILYDRQKSNIPFYSNYPSNNSTESTYKPYLDYETSITGDVTKSLLSITSNTFSSNDFISNAYQGNLNTLYAWGQNIYSLDFNPSTSKDLGTSSTQWGLPFLNSISFTKLTDDNSLKTSKNNSLVPNSFYINAIESDGLGGYIIGGNSSILMRLTMIKGKLQLVSYQDHSQKFDSNATLIKSITSDQQGKFIVSGQADNLTNFASVQINRLLSTGTIDMENPYGITIDNPSAIQIQANWNAYKNNKILSTISNGISTISTSINQAYFLNKKHVKVPNNSSTSINDILEFSGRIPSIGNQTGFSINEDALLGELGKSYYANIKVQYSFEGFVSNTGSQNWITGASNFENLFKLTENFTTPTVAGFKLSAQQIASFSPEKLMIRYAVDFATLPENNSGFIFDSSNIAISTEAISNATPENKEHKMISSLTLNNIIYQQAIISGELASNEATPFKPGISNFWNNFSINIASAENFDDFLLKPANNSLPLSNENFEIILPQSMKNIPALIEGRIEVKFAKNSENNWFTLDQIKAGELILAAEDNLEWAFFVVATEGEEITATNGTEGNVGNGDLGSLRTASQDILNENFLPFNIKNSNVENWNITLGGNTKNIEISYSNTDASAQLNLDLEFAIGSFTNNSFLPITFNGRNWFKKDDFVSVLANNPSDILLGNNYIYARVILKNPFNGSSTIIGESGENQIQSTSTDLIKFSFNTGANGLPKLEGTQIFNGQDFAIAPGTNTEGHIDIFHNADTIFADLKLVTAGGLSNDSIQLNLGDIAFPDLSSNGLKLQYSINNGIRWIDYTELGQIIDASENTSKKLNLRLVTLSNYVIDPENGANVEIDILAKTLITGLNEENLTRSNFIELTGDTKNILIDIKDNVYEGTNIANIKENVEVQFGVEGFFGGVFYNESDFIERLGLLGPNDLNTIQPSNIKVKYAFKTGAAANEFAFEQGVDEKQTPDVSNLKRLIDLNTQINEENKIIASGSTTNLVLAPNNLFTNSNLQSIGVELEYGYYTFSLRPDFKISVGYEWSTTKPTTINSSKPDRDNSNLIFDPNIDSGVFQLAIRFKAIDPVNTILTNNGRPVNPGNNGELGYEINLENVEKHIVLGSNQNNQNFIELNYLDNILLTGNTLDISQAIDNTVTDMLDKSILQKDIKEALDVEFSFDNINFYNFNDFKEKSISDQNSNGSWSLNYTNVTLPDGTVQTIPGFGLIKNIFIKYIAKTDSGFVLDPNPSGFTSILANITNKNSVTNVLPLISNYDITSWLEILNTTPITTDIGSGSNNLSGLILPSPTTGVDVNIALSDLRNRGYIVEFRAPGGPNPDTWFTDLNSITAVGNNPIIKIRVVPIGISNASQVIGDVSTGIISNGFTKITHSYNDPNNSYSYNNGIDVKVDVPTDILVPNTALNILENIIPTGSTKEIILATSAQINQINTALQNSNISERTIEIQYAIGKGTEGDLNNTDPQLILLSNSRISKWYSADDFKEFLTQYISQNAKNAILGENLQIYARYGIVSSPNNLGLTEGFVTDNGLQRAIRIVNPTPTKLDTSQVSSAINIDDIKTALEAQGSIVLNNNSSVFSNNIFKIDLPILVDDTTPNSIKAFLQANGIIFEFSVGDSAGTNEAIWINLDDFNAATPAQKLNLGNPPKLVFRLKNTGTLTHEVQFSDSNQEDASVSNNINANLSNLNVVINLAEEDLQKITFSGTTSILEINSSAATNNFYVNNNDVELQYSILKRINGANVLFEIPGQSSEWLNESAFKNALSNWIPNTPINTSPIAENVFTFNLNYGDNFENSFIIAARYIITTSGQNKNLSFDNSFVNTNTSLESKVVNINHENWSSVKTVINYESLFNYLNNSETIILFGNSLNATEIIQIDLPDPLKQTALANSDSKIIVKFLNANRLDIKYAFGDNATSAVENYTTSWNTDFALNPINLQKTDGSSALGIILTLPDGNFVAKNLTNGNPNFVNNPIIKTGSSINVPTLITLPDLNDEAALISFENDGTNVLSSKHFIINDSELVQLMSDNNAFPNNNRVQLEYSNGEQLIPNSNQIWFTKSDFIANLANFSPTNLIIKNRIFVRYALIDKNSNDFRVPQYSSGLNSLTDSNQIDGVLIAGSNNLKQFVDLSQQLQALSAGTQNGSGAIRFLNNATTNNLGNPTLSGVLDVVGVITPLKNLGIILQFSATDSTNDADWFTYNAIAFQPQSLPNNTLYARFSFVGESARNAYILSSDAAVSVEISSTVKLALLLNANLLSNIVLSGNDKFLNIDGSTINNLNNPLFVDLQNLVDSSNAALTQWGIENIGKLSIEFSYFNSTNPNLKEVWLTKEALLTEIAKNLGLFRDDLNTNVEIKARFYFTNPLGVDLNSANLVVNLGSREIQTSQLQNQSERKISSATDLRIFINTNNFNAILQDGITRFNPGSTTATIQGIPILPEDFNATLDKLKVNFGIIAQFGTSISETTPPTTWSDSSITSLLTNSNNKPILWMRFAAINSKGIIPINSTANNIEDIGELGIPLLLQPSIPVSIGVSSANLARVKISGNTKNISIDISGALDTLPQADRNKITVQFAIGGNPDGNGLIKPVQLLEGSNRIWFSLELGEDNFQTLLANYDKNILHGNEIYMRWAFASGQDTNDQALSDTNAILYSSSVANENTSFSVFADVTRYFDEIKNIVLSGTTNSPILSVFPELLQTNTTLFAEIENNPENLLFPGVELEFSDTGTGNWQKTPLSSITSTRQYYVRLVSNSTLEIDYVFVYSPNSEVVKESTPVQLNTDNVKTLVNIPNLAELQKTENISFSGTLNNLSINENIDTLRTLINNLNPLNINIGNSIEIQYSFLDNPENNNHWFTKDEFIAELAKVVGKASEEQFVILKNHIKVRFNTTDSNLLLNGQLATSISLEQQNQFEGVINLNSTILSLFKNIKITGTQKNYKLNFEDTDNESVKKILDNYVSNINAAPFSIYLTKEDGIEVPDPADSLLIYDSTNSLKSDINNVFNLDTLVDSIPQNLPLFVRIIPANSYRIFNDNLLAVNTGASFRISASSEQDNPFRIDLSDTVIGIVNNNLANWNGKVSNNTSQNFAIQGNSTIAITNGGIEISIDNYFDSIGEDSQDEESVAQAELLAFEFYISDRQLDSQERELLNSNGSEFIFTQNTPTNLKVGQYVYVRIAVDENDSNSNSFVVSQSKNIEIVISGLAIDLATSSLEFNKIEFENISGDVSFNGTSFIKSLLLNNDQNQNFDAVKIRLFNNFTYYDLNGNEVVFSNINLPTQAILDNLLKIQNAFVVKTQIGNVLSGDKQLQYIDDQGNNTEITFWVNSEGITLPPLQREIDVNNDLVFELSKNELNDEIIFSQNQITSNFDLFNLYAASTIFYQFVPLEGFTGFINENNGPLEAFSKIQTYKIPEGDIKFTVNGISQFSIVEPELINNNEESIAVSGSATFKDLIVNRNNVSINKDNLVQELENNLLSIEIIIDRTINGEIKRTKIVPINGLLEYPTNLENGDIVTIQLVPLKSDIFAIDYLKNSAAKISFTISGLEVDPGAVAFKFLRYSFNSNNNTPINGSGAFEILTNDPNDPFNSTTNPVNNDSNLEWKYTVFRSKADSTNLNEYEIILFEETTPPFNLKNGDIVNWTLSLKNNTNSGVIATQYNNAIAVPFGEANIEKLALPKEGLFYNEANSQNEITKINLENGFYVSGLKVPLNIPSNFNLNNLILNTTGQNGNGTFSVNTNNINFAQFNNNVVLTYFKLKGVRAEEAIEPNSPTSNLSNGDKIIARLQLSPNANDEFALVTDPGAVIEISVLVENLSEPSNPSAQIAIITAASVLGFVTLGIGLVSYLIIRRKKLKGK